MVAFKNSNVLGAKNIKPQFPFVHETFSDEQERNFRFLQQQQNLHFHKLPNAVCSPSQYPLNVLVSHFYIAHAMYKNKKK